MGIQIKTIKDIRFFLSRELDGMYPEDEIRAITNIALRNVLEITKLHQIYLSDEPVSNLQSSKLKRIAVELKTGKPIQYILGETIFYDCPIKLNSSALIPRPETEELADLIVSENKGYTGNIIDFGTGSGCIAISLATNLPGSSVTGTDISDEALILAEMNAKLNHVSIKFIKDDILVNNAGSLTNAGIIVSNPPYVMESEKKLMNKNVLAFEPQKALFVPDSDPLVFYTGILKRSAGLLDPQGKIYFEINEALGEQMVRLLESYGFTGIHLIKDINGKDRIIKGTRNA
jgi:release factor glutamine methyltransferase